MQTALLTDRESIELVDRERPTPASDEVLVRIREVGICGSDVHYFEHGRIGDFVVEDPLVLGHESAGEIAALGDNVDAFTVGDRVAIEPGVPCRRCGYCADGRYHLCRDISFMATPPVDGAFSEYVTWPADFVYPLPDRVTLREGALCEPLSVGLHACELAEVGPDDSVLVTGAGPIGLVTIAVVRAAGATTVAIADVVDEKLDRGCQRGADVAIDVGEGVVTTAVRDLTDGDGFDVVIEAAGAPDVYAGALEAVAPGGTIVCVGLPNVDAVPIDVVDLVTREVTLEGSFRFANTYPDAISLLESGTVDVSGLVDADYPRGEIHAAFQQTRDPTVVKVMITV